MKAWIAKFPGSKCLFFLAAVCGRHNIGAPGAPASDGAGPVYVKKQFTRPSIRMRVDICKHLITSSNRGVSGKTIHKDPLPRHPDHAE